MRGDNGLNREEFDANTTQLNFTSVNGQRRVKVYLWTQRANLSPNDR